MSPTAPSASKKRTSGLARTKQIQTLAESLSVKCHFNTDECRSMVRVHDALYALGGRVDRLRFREFLHACFDITDDIMLDLCFHGFDRNNDGVIDATEFIMGLSVMLRGNTDELIELVYYIYDMNGDRSLAREELYQCLKGCIVPGYGLDNEEIEDAERDIVEICMKKLDVNRDGQITYEDFQNAIYSDPLLIQSMGPCLPSAKSVATFLATFTDDYRAFNGVFAGQMESKKPANRLMTLKAGMTLVFSSTALAIP